MGGWLESRQDQKMEPPDHTRDFYEQMTPQIMALAGRPYQQYQGMTVAPMNSYQQTATQLAADRALYGDPLTNASRGGLLGIASGGASNPYGGASNPAFEQSLDYTRNNMTKAFNRGTQATTNALAARAGGYGGSSHIEANAANAQALGDAVGGMESGMRNDQLNRAAGIYQNDIGNQMQAAGMAPMFSMLDSQSFKDLMGYGDQLQGQLGKELGASRQEFDDQQNYPMRMADWARNSLAGLSGNYGEGWKTNEGSPMDAFTSIFSALMGKK